MHPPDHVLLELTNFHPRRLGAGRLGAIIAALTGSNRQASDYHDQFSHFTRPPHVTIEAHRP